MKKTLIIILILCILSQSVLSDDITDAENLPQDITSFFQQFSDVVTIAQTKFLYLTFAFWVGVFILELWLLIMLPVKTYPLWIKWYNIFRMFIGRIS